MRRIKRERALVDTVADEIRAAILAGTLGPGHRIRQEDFAAKLGVSRVPIRLALAVLEQEGLVQTDGARGAIVAPLDAGIIRDLYGFRGFVERHVAVTLAGRPTFDAQPCREILRLGRDAAAVGQASKLIELDLRFHTALYDAVGNRVLSEVMRGQWTHIRRVMAAALTITGYPHLVWDEHTSLLNAIEGRDSEQAGFLAEAHAARAQAVLTESLSREQARAEAEVADAPKRRKRATHTRATTERRRGHLARRD